MKNNDNHKCYPIGSRWWYARIYGGVVKIEQVEIIRHVQIEGIFSHLDTETVEQHSLRQIFNRGDLFSDKDAICKHYIRQFEKEMDQKPNKP